MDSRTTIAAWVILNDREFLTAHHAQIEPEYIPRGPMRWLIAEAKRLWEEERSLLTPETLLLRTEDTDFSPWGTSAEEVQRVYLEVVEGREWDEANAGSRRVVAMKWLRSLHYSKNIEEAAEALEAGDYDAVDRLLAKAKHAANPANKPGLTWGTKHLPPDGRPIPTGIKVLDNWWNGGLHLGQLGFVLAPSNMGKSMVLPFFAAQALRQRMNVMYYTTELSEKDVWKRIMSALSDIPINDIDDLPAMEAMLLAQLQRRAQAYATDKNYLEVRYRDPGSVGAADIRADLDDLARKDIPIHLIVVDGDDLTLGASGKQYKSFYEAYKDAYVELHTLTREREVAVWTAAQANRENYKKVYIGATATGDSLWKVRTVDLGIGINMDEKAKDEDNKPMMVLTVVKDRYYGKRNRSLRIQPKFGIKGSPGIAGFEEQELDEQPD